ARLLELLNGAAQLLVFGLELLLFFLQASKLCGLTPQPHQFLAVSAQALQFLALTSESLQFLGLCGRLLLIFRSHSFQFLRLNLLAADKRVAQSRDRHEGQKRQPFEKRLAARTGSPVESVFGEPADTIDLNFAINNTPCCKLLPLRTQSIDATGLNKANSIET